MFGSDVEDQTNKENLEILYNGMYSIDGNL